MNLKTIPSVLFSDLELAYGSKATIKSSAVGGQLLHSHHQKYPIGSGEQQITIYGHKDANNEWIIEKGLSKEDGITKDSVQFVRSGDYIRLRHHETKKYLHVNSHSAPLETRHLEVCGLNNDDVFEEWVIEKYDVTLIK